jgi:hypothetical protein
MQDFPSEFSSCFDVRGEDFVSTSWRLTKQLTCFQSSALATTASRDMPTLVIIWFARLGGSPRRDNAQIPEPIRRCEPPDNFFPCGDFGDSRLVILVRATSRAAWAMYQNLPSNMAISCKGIQRSNWRIRRRVKI